MSLRLAIRLVLHPNGQRSSQVEFRRANESPTICYPRVQQQTVTTSLVRRIVIKCIRAGIGHWLVPNIGILNSTIIMGSSLLFI